MWKGKPTALFCRMTCHVGHAQVAFTLPFARHPDPLQISSTLAQQTSTMRLSVIWRMSMPAICRPSSRLARPETRSSAGARCRVELEVSALSLASQASFVPTGICGRVWAPHRHCCDPDGVFHRSIRVRSRANSLCSLGRRLVEKRTEQGYGWISNPSEMVLAQGRKASITDPIGGTSWT